MADNNKILDRYSIVHAAIGSLFAMGGFRPIVAVGSHVAFEALEDELKRQTKGIWPDSRSDGITNHLGDIASFSVGYFGSRKLIKTNQGKNLVALFMLLGAGIWTYNVTVGDKRFKNV